MIHADKILKLPSSLYDSDPASFMGKLWSIYDAEYQVSQAAITQVKDILDIYNQSGVNLDRIGELVNELRNGRTDEQFRVNLFIALMKKLSSGSLKDVIDVCRAIITDGEFYVTQELCYNTGSELLDGKRLLDGLQPLSGSSKRPASFEMLFVGPVDQIQVPLELGRAVDDIRAGGVHGKVRVRFLLNSSAMVLQTSHEPVLNGLGLLDGKTFLVPVAKFNATQIALGDGAHTSGALRVPLITDNGLQNEVFRRNVSNYSLNGVSGYTVEIFESELNSIRLDEILLDGPEGILAIQSYDRKEKNTTILYEFAIMEDNL